MDFLSCVNVVYASSCDLDLWITSHKAKQPCIENTKVDLNFLPTISKIARLTMSSSPHHAQTSSNDGNIYVFVHGSDEERPAEEGECSLSDSEAQQQGGEVFRDHNTANSSRHSSVSLEDMMIPSLKTSLSEDNETDDTCEVSASSSEEECLPEEHHEHPDDPEQTPNAWLHDVVWLTICFVGIMTSFVAYGILLEYTTSGDKRLAERT